jgi:AcrR family transcriptional regulator
MKGASLCRAATSSVPSVRDRLLEVAKIQFSTHGYDNTSTVSLARLAGTSESQLMKHFGSKEGLLVTIFEEEWRRLFKASLQAFEGVASPTARLRILVDLLLNTLEEDRQFKLILLLEGRRIRRQGQIVTHTRGFLDLVDLIDTLLGNMNASGQLRRSINPQAVRSALVGALEGMLRDQLLSQTMKYPARYSPTQLRETFELILSAFTVTTMSAPG